MTALFIIKYGSDRIKTVGGVAFWKFRPIWYALCYKKICSYVKKKYQSAIKFLIFGRSPKKPLSIFPNDQHTYNKVW